MPRGVERKADAFFLGATGGPTCHIVLRRMRPQMLIDNPHPHLLSAEKATWRTICRRLWLVDLDTAAFNFLLLIVRLGRMCDTLTQTHKRFKRTLFIRKKHKMRIWTFYVFGYCFRAVAVILVSDFWMIRWKKPCRIRFILFYFLVDRSSSLFVQPFA